MVVTAIARLSSVMHVSGVARTVRVDIAASEVLMHRDIPARNACEADGRWCGRGDDRVTVRQSRVCRWSTTWSSSVGRNREASAWGRRGRRLIVVDAVTYFCPVVDVSRVLWAVGIDVWQGEVRLHWDVSA